FQTWTQSVAVRTTVPIDLKVQLAVAGQQLSVTVVARPDGLLENTTVASHTVDQSTLAALPVLSPGSGLNDAIIFTTPNVAADSNGFFHPLGDHAQVSYVIDGQPISDQRNKVFSTSIPENAIQSMELISGSPAAEYGDKTSLVVNANTRSALGQKPSGSFLAHYGSFGTVGEEATLGIGGARWGSFAVVNTERTGRFLDTPEFRPIHDVGNTGTFFDRIDFRPTGKDSFHLDLLSARNWLQIPNTYDQPRQDQRQKVVSYNIAPGYQRTIDARTLVTVNAYFRRDQVDYYPSRNLFDDLPATLAQHRSLTNYGLHSDLSRIEGRHNFKAGVNATQTKLNEAFSLGVTNPSYNAPCDDQSGEPVPSSAFKSASQCAASGLQANPNFQPGLLPYDLTRGGSPYRFQGKATISQVAWFGQDTITLGNMTVNIGLRYDYYNGIARGSGPEPRGAISYLFKPTKTVIRGGYTHSLETPVNENLVVSSSTGSGGLASNLFQGTAEQRPIALGSRNQYDAGIQQSLGRWVLIDVSYFRKYTRNAYDFDALFSTPITFPIGWAQSKLDGVGARVSTPDIHGLRMFATMGHANARFFGPENGGIIFNSNLSVGAYRQDHDQVYQQNVNIHYQPKKSGWWTDFTWRYDSGLVVGAINNLGNALALTAAQQSGIGFYCGGEQASLTFRIASCNSASYGAQRINIIAPGKENDDRNPPRTKPRNIFHLGIGNDNLFHKEHIRTVVRFTVVNLSNEASLYNFLSPFSGTHWFQPRSFQGQLGWAF
ncbi:MAG: TonB-dependent receptor, partial [Bryobacterales bacterium]|nr:TonB-dependent receptor [Bryobacterales bacterium]